MTLSPCRTASRCTSTAPAWSALLLAIAVATITGNPAHSQDNPPVDLPTALSAADAAAARSQWTAQRQGYKQACDLGSPRACLQLAVLEYRGRGGPVDRATARQRIARHRQAAEQACAARDGESCVAVGQLLAQGVGLPSDVTAAAQLMHRACGVGSVAGCATWAEHVAEGSGTSRDQRAALTLLERACEGGIPDACTLRGAKLIIDPVNLSGDVTAAHQWFDLGCARGSLLGCFDLAVLLTQGAACRADPAAATAHWQAACSGGYAQACTYLGWYAWADELAGKARRPHAVAWLALACSGGDAAGCYWLGKSWDDPKRGPRDVARAAEAYREGCLREDGDSCSRLSVLYLSGEVAAPDTPQTWDTYELGCHAGESRACRELGRPIPGAVKGTATGHRGRGWFATALGVAAAPVPQVVLGAAHPLVLAWPIRPAAFVMARPSSLNDGPTLLLIPDFEPQYRVGEGWRYAAMLRSVLTTTAETYSTWGLLAEAGAIYAHQQMGGLLGTGIEYGFHRGGALATIGLGMRLTSIGDQVETAVVFDFHFGAVLGSHR